MLRQGVQKIDQPNGNVRVAEDRESFMAICEPPQISAGTAVFAWQKSYPKTHLQGVDNLAGNARILSNTSREHSWSFIHTFRLAWTIKYAYGCIWRQERAARRRWTRKLRMRCWDHVPEELVKAFFWERELVPVNLLRTTNQGRPCFVEVRIRRCMVPYIACHH